ncbi:(R)-phenyllactate dehydratase activator [subsurface metagenome]
MIVAGCDVGSTTGKAVIMNDHTIASYTIMWCRPRPEETARIAINEVMEKVGLSSLEELDYIVGTGYGRLKIPFANENISEITCHGVGAHWLRNSVRTIIDIGGQDLKVIGLDDSGRVIDFVMNDKCAAGTGKFLENMARALGLTLEELSTISLEATNPAVITSQCSVFAESEVITLLNEGEEVANIANGIHASIASRLVTLVRRVGAKNDITIAGGCAKNAGLIDVLEKRLDTEIVRLPEDPQIIGAIGAALLATERLERSASSK